jgi:hypothetical protein
MLSLCGPPFKTMLIHLQFVINKKYIWVDFLIVLSLTKWSFQLFNHYLLLLWIVRDILFLQKLSPCTVMTCTLSLFSMCVCCAFPSGRNGIHRPSDSFMWWLQVHKLFFNRFYNLTRRFTNRAWNFVSLLTYVTHLNSSSIHSSAPFEHMAAIVWAADSPVATNAVPKRTQSCNHCTLALYRKLLKFPSYSLSL